MGAEYQDTTRAADAIKAARTIATTWRELVGVANQVKKHPGISKETDEQLTGFLAWGFSAIIEQAALLSQGGDYGRDELADRMVAELLGRSADSHLANCPIGTAPPLSP